MSAEIEVKVADEVVGSENIKITPYAIEFAGSPTIEEWHKAVLGIQKVHGMMQFYLGDLIVFADSPVTGWGESKYQALIEQTGYDYQTLRVFAAVSRRFTPDFRKQILEYVATSQHVSWGHFREVMALGDIPARHFLEMVSKARWSVVKLREEVRKYGNMKPEVEGDAEIPEGRVPFNSMTRQALKGFQPTRDDGYNEVDWLLEMKDWIETRLRELNVLD